MEVKMNTVTFEEALDMTGFGKFNMEIMLLVCNVVIAMAFETTSVAYLVPASACELQTTTEQQGLMAGMPLVGILAASNIWGYLADTRGRRKTLFVALILGFITGVSATLAPNWIFFCIAKFLSSSSMAGTYGLANTYLGECTPVANRSRLIVLITTVFATAVGCMAVIAIPFLPLTFSYYIPLLDIHFNSWRLLNIIFSLPCLLAAIGAHYSYESPKYLLSAGHDKKAMDILRKMYVKNTGGTEDQFKVISVTLNEDKQSQKNQGFLQSVISQTVPLLKPPLLQRTMLLSFIFVTVYICVNPFTVWIPFIVDGLMRSVENGDRGLTFCQMLESSKNLTSSMEVASPETNNCALNNTAMMMVFATYMILATLNTVASSVLPCFGRKKMLIGIQLIGGLSALAVNSSTMWMVTATLIIIFLVGMLNFGLLSSFSVDMFPTYVKAMGVCLTLMVGRGSAVFGINLLKNLLTYHCESTFYIYGGIAILGGVIALLLPSDNTQTEKKDEQTEKSDVEASKL